MEWLKKLSSAIAYIEENLDKEISYDKAAELWQVFPCLTISGREE